VASEGRVAALPGAAWHGDAVCVVCNCRLQLIDLHAARVNAQAEFDRTFRAVVKAEDYRHRKLLFMSCLNIGSFPE
jgi:hypothetical protein